MRKAFCVGLLLVFAWTSVVQAQISIVDYMVDLEPYGEETVLGDTGYQWATWSQSEKTMWVAGFIGGWCLLQSYAYRQLLEMRLSRDWLIDLAATTFNFRVGVYTLELDAIYDDPANRAIYLADALFIANERLNGRDVDLTPWRNKGQEQEGT